MRYLILLLVVIVPVSSATAVENINTAYTYYAIKRYYAIKGSVLGLIEGCNDISDEISHRRTAEYSQWLVRHDDFEDRIRRILPYVLNFENRQGMEGQFEELRQSAQDSKTKELYNKSRPDRTKACDWELKAMHIGSYDVKPSSKDAKAINNFAAWLKQVQSGHIPGEDSEQVRRREQQKQNKINHLASGNLLANASFKNQLQGWSVVARGRWLTKPAVGKDGALMLHTKIPSNPRGSYENKVEQCVRLNNGEKYLLRAKFKAEKVLQGEYAETAQYGNRIYIIWFFTDHCGDGPRETGGWIEPNNITGWQNLSIDNQTPSFGAKSVQIAVTQNGRYSRGYKAYWDDIQFFATEVADPASQQPQPPNPKYTLALNENYLLNGSFAKDLSSWHSFTSSPISRSHLRYQSTWSSQGYHSPGSVKVKFTSNKGSFGAGAGSQCVNIGANTKFRFGAMVKKDPHSSQQGGGAIRVNWNNKENCSGRSKTDHNWAKFKNIEGWHAVTVENLVAPEHTHSVEIELIQSISGPGIYTLYWDDVYFTAVE